MCLLGINAKGSHVSSADITYECLGSNMYKINVKMYRDCAGQPSGPFQQFTISSASCGVPKTYYFLSLVSSSEVSQVCSTQLSNTTCGSGTVPGIEVYEYTTTVTLPFYCSDWEFEFLEPFRSNSLTNFFLIFC